MKYRLGNKGNNYWFMFYFVSLDIYGFLKLVIVDVLRVFFCLIFIVDNIDIKI